MKKLTAWIGGVGCVALVWTLLAPETPAAATNALPEGPLCIQDQYGNQYTLNIDFGFQYVSGTAVSAQNCSVLSWPILGSYTHTAAGLLVELTAVNPLGDSDPNCISEYKLKGLYPDFSWFYETGYGGQDATYASCGTPAPLAGTHGGQRR